MISTTDLSSIKGFVFDLHRFSIHDGPGIRTTVFLKGCPLACVWCHNPESKSVGVEKIVRQARCIRCGACVEACPEHAVSLNGDGIVTDRERCTACGNCAEVCVADASEMVGKETSAADLLQEIERDRLFYDESGGGVTFSGGEPLLQLKFLEAVMTAAHTRGIRTALDTSGYVPWESFLKVLPFTDLVLYDLKLMDDQKHFRYTGVSNQIILENLRKLNRQGKKIWLRFPVIPGLNDDETNLKALAKLAKNLHHVERINLLPYHTAAIKKYEGLGQDYPLTTIESPSEERMDELADWFEQFGLPAVVGG